MTGGAGNSVDLTPKASSLQGLPLPRQCQLGIQGRMFLVGCPRSGTTLLQSMLAAHPRIASYPETHFFERVSPWFAAVGLASPRRRDRRRLLQFLSEVGHPELETLIPRYAVTLRKSIGTFVEVMDALTLAQGKTTWVEKTPGHLHHVDLIEAYLPDARFIHMVRNGEDVVASLYEVSSGHPEIWGTPATLERCIARWTGDLELTRLHIQKPQHTLVQYEQLLESPQPVLAELCGFLGVEFNQDMLSQHSSAVEKLVLENETWKDTSRTDELRRPAVRKFDQIFDREQQAYIRARLAAPRPVKEQPDA